MKISVIIPVYNTKAYLDRCISSVIGQTYQNIEIVLIDDGSTDGSEQIVDYYARADARVIAVHQTNAGESAARNRGLEIATGGYITFMDCDDWIEPDMYENMMASAIPNELDLVLCGYSMDYDDHRVIVQNEHEVSQDIISRKELFQYVYIRDRYRAVTSWIWCKLFKRELIHSDDGILRFDESVRFGADILFFLQAASKVEKAQYIYQPYYHYYQRKDSTSHTQDLAIAYEIVDIYQRMIDFCIENKIELQIVPWLQRFKVYRATLVAEQAYEQQNGRILSMCQRIMKQYETIYRKTNDTYPDRIERFDSILKLHVNSWGVEE